MENETLRQESRDKIREMLNKADGVEEVLSQEQIKALQKENRDLEDEVKSLGRELEHLRDKSPNDIPAYTLPAQEVVDLVKENIDKLTRHHLLFEEFLQLLE